MNPRLNYIFALPVGRRYLEELPSVTFLPTCRQIRTVLTDNETYAFAFCYQLSSMTKTLFVFGQNNLVTLATV